MQSAGALQRRGVACRGLQGAVGGAVGEIFMEPVVAYMLSLGEWGELQLEAMGGGGVRKEWSMQDVGAAKKRPPQKSPAVLSGSGNHLLSGLDGLLRRSK